MLKKTTPLFVFVCLIMMHISCAQANRKNDIKLINDFLDALFDRNIYADKVADKYLYTTKYSIDEPKDSIIDGRKMAIDHIKLVRKEVENDMGWLLPNKKVASLKVRNIFPIIDYSELDKLGLSEKESIKNIYVLLNPDKNEILEYFYVVDNKIYAFSLLVKGDTGFFYIYHE